MHFLCGSGNRNERYVSPVKKCMCFAVTVGANFLCEFAWRSSPGGGLDNARPKIMSPF